MVKFDKEKFDIVKFGAKGSNDIRVIVDKETGVQYLLATSLGLGAGMTVLVDENGKPKLRK